MKKLFFFFLVLLFGCGTQGQGVKNMEHGDKNYWKNGYFHQKTVKVLDYEKWMVKAKVEGKWRTFQLVDLPDDFVKWSAERRLETLERVRKKQMPSLSGPHNGMVASYGVKRKDSQFKINNAVKGWDFYLKERRLRS